MKKTNKEVEKQEEKHDFINRYYLQTLVNDYSNDGNIVNTLTIPVLYHSNEFEDEFMLAKDRMKEDLISRDYPTAGAAKKEELIDYFCDDDFSESELLSMEEAVIIENVIPWMLANNYLIEKKGRWNRSYKLTNKGLEWLIEANNDY